ncbi:MAG: hypothetical protein ACT4OJ_00450 [Bacteroidota bacterium]
MALNKNHEFEELNGVKCGIVEKNVTPERVAFLKELLEHNGFEVVLAITPPPKIAPVLKPAEESAETPQPPASNIEPPTIETFTIGVTDYTFNPINAIFGRQLKAKDGSIVTLAYWNQQEAISNDEVPYYEN